MSDEPIWDHSQGSLQDLEALDEICMQFEQSWKAGNTPRVETHLDLAPRAIREPLLEELLHIDLEYRRKLGDQPEPDEYARRFPADKEAVAKVFDALKTRRRGALDETDDSTTVQPAPDMAIRPGAREGSPPDRLIGEIPHRIGRYGIFEEIDRGGMGVILRGRDPVLGRELAFKVIREELKDDAGAVRRFIAEARITGQLQHPGVAPVHELGRCSDGRPYFSMKLIQGRALDLLLKERNGPAEGLPGFLRIFEQICQTVAYAHSQGVVHRDLKPLNVMVGAFGECQVLDWGLARRSESLEIETTERSLPQQPVNWQPYIGTSSADESKLEDIQRTREGQVMGTLAYMAPEQARGQVERFGPWSDVFGLGAILCEILTGEPPYPGKSRDKVLEMAQAGKLEGAFASLDACGADAELIDLSKRCLAVDPDERPRNGQGVLEAVAGYLARLEQRLHRARIDRAVAQARAVSERRARRLTVGLAAAILLVVFGGSGAWLYIYLDRRSRIQDELREAAVTQAAVSAALTEVESSLSSNEDWRDALPAFEKAAALLREGGSTELRNRLAQAQRDLQMAERLEEIHLQKANVRDGHFDTLGALAGLADAFRSYDMDIERLSREVVGRRIHKSTIRDRLTGALEEWSLYAPLNSRRRLLDTLESADDDPWWNRFHRADRATMIKMASGADVFEKPPQTISVIASSLLFQDAVIETVSLLRRAQRLHPDDFWINHDLASALVACTPPQLEEAVGYYRAAIAVRPTSPGAYVNLGLALRDAGQLDDAIAAWRKAIELKPDYATAHSNLGVALGENGQLEDAFAAYRKAVDLDPDDAKTYSNLGNALSEAGQLDDAIAACRKAIELDPDYARAHHNLGVALGENGQLEDALAAYRKAIELESDYAEAHCNLGIALKQNGQLEDAIAAYRKAIELAPDFARAHNNLGNALKRNGQLEDAIGAYHKAIELDQDHAKAHSNLGIALSEAGQLDDAIAACRKAIELEPDFAIAHNNLGNALKRNGRLEDAMAAYRKAIELDPGYAKAHSSLGNALIENGQLEDAIAACRKAIELDPDYAVAHFTFGLALIENYQLEDAIAAYRKAIELDPDLATAHYNLGNALDKYGQLEDAIASYHKSIELKPDYAEAHCNLGSVLRHQGRFAESLAQYKRGHELGSKNPRWPYPSAAWTKHAVRLIELDAKLPAILSGDAQPASAAEQLEYSTLCYYKRRYGVALKLCMETAAGEPLLVKGANRYNAACLAVLAASGQGEEPIPSGEQRARLRKLALDWLRADLVVWTKRLENGQPNDQKVVQNALRNWERDKCLSPIRNQTELAKLAIQEREDCEQLWADVAALLKRAQHK